MHVYIYICIYIYIYIERERERERERAHSQGFSICFLIKKPFNSPWITFNFQNKLYIQSEQRCRQHALYSPRARYNTPIRIPVRMVQII